MPGSRGALTGGSFGVAAPRASFIGQFIIALFRSECPRKTWAPVQTDPAQESKVSNFSLMRLEDLYDASVIVPRGFDPLASVCVERHTSGPPS